MLHPEEIREIEREIERLPERRSACIEALKAVQRHRGWVSDEALGELARFLHMSESELESIATFYNLIFRKPVGRHVVFVCDSVSCWILRGEQLKRSLTQKLGIAPGQTSSDGRFTLLTIQCLGACERAPALMIDRTTHAPVSPSDLERLLEEYE